MTDGPELRIGLLGGTFDPVHVGHLVVAEHLRIGLGLSQVRLLVAGAPWMKGRITEPEARVAMARAAVQGLEGLGVDDQECQRGGPTYTADTLAALDAAQPGTRWFFALGADAAAHLHRWERVEEVLALATVVVVNRPGEHAAVHPDLADRVERLAVPALDISSSNLRERFATGQATRFLVPPPVYAQIRQRGLYGAPHG